MAQLLKGVVDMEERIITVTAKYKYTCKHSRRFDVPDENEKRILSTIYVKNAGLDAIGNPSTIHVTIENAD
jgi:hypothetical protein